MRFCVKLHNSSPAGRAPLVALLAFFVMLLGIAHATRAADSWNVATYPDRVAFQLTSDALDKLCHGDDASKITVEPNPGFVGGWNLIKFDGKVYVRGWIALPPSEFFLEKRTFDIFNYPNVPETGSRPFPTVMGKGVYPIQITLCLENFRYGGFYERLSVAGDENTLHNAFESKLTVLDAHLDKHAWEDQVSPNLHREGSEIRPDEATTLQEDKVPKVPVATDIYRDKGIQLSEVPDDKPFALSHNSLPYLLSGTPPSQLWINKDFGDPARSNEYKFWQLVKHVGNIYLRAWIGSDFSPEVSRNHFVHLFNSPDALELRGAGRQVTLKIGSFRYRPFHRLYQRQWYFSPAKGFEESRFHQQLVVTDVHLDEHADDKW